MALPIKDFILNDLNRKEEDGTTCFSYTPLDQLAVHNANLLGFLSIDQLYKYTRDENLKNTALQSLAYSMKHQREDGSWYYAETEMQKWIDSFHTVLISRAYYISLKRDLQESIGKPLIRVLNSTAIIFFWMTEHRNTTTIEFIPLISTLPRKVWFSFREWGITTDPYPIR